MAAPLKDSFGPAVPRRIARAIVAVHPAFPASAFIADALDGYDDLELTPRVRQIARALNRHLPPDFDEAIGILLASLGPPSGREQLTGMAAFLYAPHVFFVADFGREHWETSMRAQHELTQLFTAEYSIRTFLESEPERTLARLRQWAIDPSPDVRRLVSEGTRPRLPWAPRLRRFQVNPAPVLELLEVLKDDPSLYVRRSVANNLNDIGKDHPDVLVATCRRWLERPTKARRWLVRHALRSAVKRGDPAALDVLGFRASEPAVVHDVTLEPSRPRIGEGIRITAVVGNGGNGRTAFNVDPRIHFVKANGGRGPKVFKLREVELGVGQRVTLSKLVSLRQQTTRTHYPGEHQVDLLINGTTYPAGSFVIV